MRDAHLTKKKMTKNIKKSKKTRLFREKLRFVYKNSHAYERRHRLFSRTEKSINLLTRCGNKKRAHRIVLDLKVMIGEHFAVHSTAIFLERILKQLEPIEEVRSLLARKLRRQRRRNLDNSVVVTCTQRRRTYLGLQFLIRAVGVIRKKVPVMPIAVALMSQIIGLHFKHTHCQAFRLRLEHDFGVEYCEKRMKKRDQWNEGAD